CAAAATATAAGTVAAAAEAGRVVLGDGGGDVLAHAVEDGTRQGGTLDGLTACLGLHQLGAGHGVNRRQHQHGDGQREQHFEQGVGRSATHELPPCCLGAGGLPTTAAGSHGSAGRLRAAAGGRSPAGRPTGGGTGGAGGGTGGAGGGTGGAGGTGVVAG